VFEDLIERQLAEAEARGAPSVCVNAGEVHRAVGGYPGPDHRMPVCCRVMRDMMRDGDRVTSEPRKGQGASLEIEYRLPRPI
jgi:hypothetical protein